MRLVSALTCDFAQVREGLMFISSGGVTTFFAESYPAQLNLYLALTFIADKKSLRSEPYTLDIEFASLDGTSLGGVKAALQLQAADEPNAEYSTVAIPVSLGFISVAEEGSYSVRVSVDGNEVEQLPLLVASRSDLKVSESV